MIDLDAMTARELTAGLMRGDRLDMKLGYSALSAAHAAAATKHITVPSDAWDGLLSWAEGFQDGMADAIEQYDPQVRYRRTGLDGAKDAAAYTTGRAQGRREAGPTLYPSIPRVES